MIWHISEYVLSSLEKKVDSGVAEHDQILVMQSPNKSALHQQCTPLNGRGSISLPSQIQLFKKKLMVLNIS